MANDRRGVEPTTETAQNTQNLQGSFADPTSTITPILLCCTDLMIFHSGQRPDS